MVKARQMKDPMQSQDLDFLGGRMSELERIFPGNISRDGNLACQLRSFTGLRG